MKTINELTNEITEKRSSLGDEIVRTMLKKQHLPFSPKELEQAGYILVIENEGTITRYKLAKLVDMHTITEKVTEKSNGSFSFELIVDVTKEVLA